MTGTWRRMTEARRRMIGAWRPMRGTGGTPPGPGGRAAVARLAAAAVLVGCLTAPAAAQDPDEVRIGITYRPGYVPALAMPPVRAAADLSGVAVRVDEILRMDLDYSDRFEMLPVSDTLAAGSSVNYALWNQLGAVWLVAAEMRGSPGSPILRVGLHDVVYGNLQNVQAFALPSSQDDAFRMAVHRVADAVVEWATGEPGMAASRIAFRRKLGDERSEVFIVDSDGHNLRQLTGESAIVYSPALSPDGSRLAYVVYVDGEPRVLEMDLASGRRRTISAERGLNITPAYTPDGRRIAFARTVGGRTQIFETGRGQIVRTATGDALNPSYSPDGSRIAFEADPLGQQQVYVQPVQGGQPRLISRYVHGERGSASGPDWSPRGDRIAYTGWVDGVWQIFAVNPDGTDRRALTSRGRNEDPSWAPDGRHVVFASQQRTGRSLMVLDVVTGRTRVLVSGQVDQLPSWSGPIPEP